MHARTDSSSCACIYVYVYVYVCTCAMECAGKQRARASTARYTSAASPSSFLPRKINVKNCIESNSGRILQLLTQNKLRRLCRLSVEVR